LIDAFVLDEADIVPARGLANLSLFQAATLMRTRGNRVSLASAVLRAADTLVAAE
jgi:hypothetical protein